MSDISDEKVYKPEEILDNPLPDQITDESLNPSNSSPGPETVRPSSMRDSGFPRRIIAQETISESLNTKSRKIIAVFEFIKQGALQIGEFINGVSGDIRISPRGITARDSSGNVSFNLDGETGDAQFRGSVEANDFQITGGGITAIALEGQRSLGGFGSIQAGINWLNDLGGGSLFLPGGIYEVTSNITMFSNIKIIGQDDESTILDFMGTNASIIAGSVNISPFTTTNIEFQNLQFRGRRASSTSTLEGLIVAGVTDLFIRECKFTDNWNSTNNAGIDIVIGGTRGLIQGCKFVSSGKNIVSRMEQLLITDNLFESSSAEGIFLISGSDIRIEDNIFDGLTGSAIKTDSTGDDIGGVKVDNNSIKSQKGTAINIGDGTESSGWSITNNDLSGVASPNSGDGIYMGSSARENIIIGNTILSFKDGDGIDNDGGDENIITSNKISFCSAYGISLNASTLNNLVHGNILDSNTSGGIQDLGTNTSTDNLTI